MNLNLILVLIASYFVNQTDGDARMITGLKAVNSYLDKTKANVTRIKVNRDIQFTINKDKVESTNLTDQVLIKRKSNSILLTDFKTILIKAPNESKKTEDEIPKKPSDDLLDVDYDFWKVS